MHDQRLEPIPGLDPGFWLALCFLAVLVGIGVYDLVAIFSQGRIHTVTHYLVSWSKEFPLVGYAAGFLCGHLFFPRV